MSRDELGGASVTNTREPLEDSTELESEARDHSTQTGRAINWATAVALAAGAGLRDSTIIWSNRLTWIPW